MWNEAKENNIHLAWNKVGKNRFYEILSGVRTEMLVRLEKSDIAYLLILELDWMRGMYGMKLWLTSVHQCGKRSHILVKLKEWLKRIDLSQNIIVFQWN